MKKTKIFGILTFLTGAAFINELALLTPNVVLSRLIVINTMVLFLTFLALTWFYSDKDK
jgi:hypothetical protein